MKQIWKTLWCVSSSVGYTMLDLSACSFWCRWSFHSDERSRTWFWYFRFGPSMYHVVSFRKDPKIPTGSTFSMDHTILNVAYPLSWDEYCIQSFPGRSVASVWKPTFNITVMLMKPKRTCSLHSGAGVTQLRDMEEGMKQRTCANMLKLNQNTSN